MNVIGVIKDVATGYSLGNVTRHASTIHETVVGNGYGLLAPGMYNSITSEVVTGEGYGTILKTYIVTSEVVSGNSLGLNIKPQFATAFIEVVGRDSSYKFVSTVREVVGSFPNESSTIIWWAQTGREIVAQRRNTLPIPSRVWSTTPVATLVQIAAQRRVRPGPISMHTLLTARQVAVVNRGVPAPADVLSPMRATLVREIALVSRTIAYVPVSGLAASLARQVAVMRRVTPPPSSRRSSINAISERQIVLVSKRDVSSRAVTTVEIVLLAKVSQAFTAPTRYAAMVELAVQKRVMPTVRSSVNAAVLRQVLLLAREIEAVTSPTRVGSYVSVAVQGRVLPFHRSFTTVGSYVQVALRKRAVIRYWSPLLVSTVRQITLLDRIPGPLPPTPMYVEQVMSVAVQHRAALPPSSISEWYTKTAAQITLAKVSRVKPESAAMVRTLRVQYLLAANYPPPDEVLGPDKGILITQQVQISVLRRAVDPPAGVNTSRIVRNLGEQVVVVESYPAPSGAMSDALAFGVAQQAVLPQAYDDPTLVASDALVAGVAQQVVSVDSYPDPLLADSMLTVTELYQPVLIEDAFADPTIVLSDVDVFTVVQNAAVGDDFYPNPTLPTSEVKSFAVASPVAILDVSYPDPSLAMSEAAIQAVGQLVVAVDKSLYGVPKRTDRRRPVVSVSIT